MSVVSESEEGQSARALFPLRRDALLSCPGRGVQVGRGAVHIFQHTHVAVALTGLQMHALETPPLFQ